MAFQLTIVLTLAFVAGISAQLENEDANGLFSYGEPIIINIDSLPSDQIETTADKQTRTNLIAGSIACDTRVYYGAVHRQAVNNQIQIQDYIINSPTHIRHSYIYALERANNQAQVRIFNGGIGYPTVTLRFQSAVSRPIDYIVEVWGR